MTGCAIRRRAWFPPRRATFADIDTIETPNPNTVMFKMKAVNVVDARAFREPVELRLFGEGSRG